jgi:exopolysaccharide biosynthesis polyprenyl glycosylphosphotransferase
MYASMAADLAIMIGSFTLAIVVLDGHVNGSLGSLLSMEVKVRNFALFVIFAATWNLIFNLLSLYDSKRLSTRVSEVIDVLTATTLGTVYLFVGATLFNATLITYDFLLVFWTMVTLSTAGTRSIARTALSAIRKRGRNTRYMLIVGTNLRALDFAHRVEAKPELGYKIVGFADQQWQGNSLFAASGYRIVANFETLPRYIRENVIDEVVLALPIRSFHAWESELAALCEEQGIITRYLPDLFELKWAHHKAVELADEAIITQYTGNSEGWPLLVKRALDAVLSLGLLLLLIPVLLISALLIRLTSPGPILFVQQRLGLNKRRFDMYKFRTMCADAEQRMREVEHLNEVSGPVFKIKNDPRITPVGRFLRRTSIDELPQLFNVLKGDMSLVGPRPLSVRDYELMTATADCQNWQRCRFSVRPGITCLWQINGRNSIPFEQWMQLDREYVYGWSLWLDLVILVRTIPVVLKGSGAA